MISMDKSYKYSRTGDPATILTINRPATIHKVVSMTLTGDIFFSRQ